MVVSPAYPGALQKGAAIYWLLCWACPGGHYYTCLFEVSLLDMLQMAMSFNSCAQLKKNAKIGEYIINKIFIIY